MTHTEGIDSRYYTLLLRSEALLDSIHAVQKEEAIDRPEVSRLRGELARTVDELIAMLPSRSLGGTGQGGFP